MCILVLFSTLLAFCLCTVSASHVRLKMGDVIEALFISCMNNERASCNVQDLRTGTDLMRYKGGGTMQQHSLQMLGGNFVIAANSTKPLLHVWPLNGQEQMSTIRYVVPGKVNALAITPDGAYLVAGIQETIYLWHLNTGRLLNTMSKHYQPITCIRFTDSGEHFVTAGKDGAVLVWNLTQSCAPSTSGDSDDNAPLYSFNDHGLTVTDVHIGHGGIRAFMYTVSLDRCCKVYDLSNGSMLLSVVFPVALHSVIVNRLETSVYVGTGEGQVLIFHMDKAPRMKVRLLRLHQLVFNLFPLFTGISPGRGADPSLGRSHSRCSHHVLGTFCKRRAAHFGRGGQAGVHI